MSLLFNEKHWGLCSGLKVQRPLKTSEVNLALPGGPAANRISAKASRKSGLGEGGGVRGSGGV